MTSTRYDVLIAGDLCIYTNRNLVIESLEWSE